MMGGDSMQGGLIRPNVTPGQDRTQDDPSKKTPEQAQQAANLTEEDKKNLIKVMNHFAMRWSYNHRGNIKRTSRVFEYLRDRQYIYWDSFAGRYVDPFEETSSLGSQQGNDDVWGYKYVNNVLQFLERVISNTLSPQLPETRFQPSDAEEDSDVQAAEEASKAQAFLERQNNARRLLRQRLLYLFAAGNYFRYTRWVRDSDRYESSKEPVWTMAPEEVAPAHYLCQSCGAQVPDQGALPANAGCPQCGAKLDQSDWHEPVIMDMPKIVALEDVPNGGVAWSLYNTLQVLVSPDCNDPTVDPLTATPILKLDDEIDVASLRAQYPEAWDLLNRGNTTATSGGDAEYARLARTRLFTSMPGRAGTLNDERPTLTRCWMRATAFNCLGTKADADALRAKFPDGCKLVCVGDQFLECFPEKLTDHWTWCGTRPGFGAYPPAIADPAMPYQDRINDCANNTHNYMDRLASPDILANVDLIDVEGWNGVSMSGGGMKPVKLKKGGTPASGSLDGAFFQPEFHIDPKIFSYQDSLMLQVQVIIGATPQTWGGGQDHIDTASGQKQALNVATSVLQDYWGALCEEDANAAKLSVKCLGQNAMDNPANPVEADDDSAPGQKFKNNRINLQALKGNFLCYPDTTSGLPSTEDQIRERLTEMMSAAKENPVIMETFQPMQNRRLAMKALGPKGFVVPGQDTWDAVMQDIGKLMQGQPQIGGPDPSHPDLASPMPTGPNGEYIIPDPELYDLDVAMQACQEWGLRNRDKVKDENPGAWQNFLLYLRLTSKLQAQKQMMAQGAPPMNPQPSHMTPKGPPALPAAPQPQATA